jgi:hypothetical protein
MHDSFRCRRLPVPRHCAIDLRGQFGLLGVCDEFAYGGQYLLSEYIFRYPLPPKLYPNLPRPQIQH